MTDAMTDDEKWFWLRNHDPKKYEGRIDPLATSEDIRKRYNRGRYAIIVPDDDASKCLTRLAMFCGAL